MGPIWWVDREGGRDGWMDGWRHSSRTEEHPNIVQLGGEAKGALMEDAAVF